jgi:isopenicillin-N N-acyltransferase-like protein
MFTMGIEIIDVAGDAHSRGQTFGQTRRKQIQSCMVDWLNSLRIAGLDDPESYIAQMLRDTSFLSTIREHTPALLDEVRGIAFGANLPPELMLAAQFMDEEWAYRAKFLRDAHTHEKCSSVAINSGSGVTWIGQNMDLGGFTDGHQILLRIAPCAPEPDALIFTIGGMIGLLGVNARGVGICVNSLPQLPAARTGLPVAFVIRRLLEAESAAEAVRLVLKLPHATGQHYLIADPVSIRSFEASPERVVEYHSPDPSRLLHTNHPLAEQKGEPSSRDETNTVARLRSLTDRLMTAEPGLDKIKAALSSSDDPDHSVCRVASANSSVSSLTGMISFTTGSMISELKQGSRAVDSWISAGPPSLRGYTHIRLTEDT